MNTSSKQSRRVSRHVRVRAKISGTASRPRVAVYKSNKYTYAQVIDDTARVTILSVSDYAGKKTKSAKGTKIEKATSNGKALADALKKKGIDAVLFDRGGFKYHGRVKALAEGLREAGIKM
ncbi:MAG: 50S ribosomal protein L18 [Candidatus Pacebacteria bacterium]|nr:50S ribosomal protein L18 [Candidatus Paceibacterota bacterium]